MATLQVGSDPRDCSYHRAVCTSCMQWKEPGSSQFTTIPPDHFAMAVKCEAAIHVHTVDDDMWSCSVTDTSEYEEGWPIADELLKELPSNTLQSHGRVKYIGDTVYHSEERGRGGEGGICTVRHVHSPNSHLP